MLRALALAAAALALGTATAACAQSVSVVPPGREAVVLEAVREAFGDARPASVSIERTAIIVDTGDGATLTAARRPPVQVRLSCAGGCDASARARWAPVALDLEESLSRRAGAIWIDAELAPWARAPGPAPSSAPLRARQALSYAVLLLVLVGLGLAPGRRTPAGRRSVAIALLAVATFFVVALTLSPPRPLHDHLCFLERARCAASLSCEVTHHAWGRPTFHLVGLLLAAIPHRLAWILGAGVLLTALALWLVYDVTVRLATRAGFEHRAGAAGLWALAFAALHPGVLRLAGATPFWPLTLVLLLAAVHLWLRASEGASEGEGGRRTLALFSAGGAFALALAGNRGMLTLAPWIVIAPYAWPVGRIRGVSLLAAVLPVAAVAVGAHDVLRGDYYGAGASLAQPLDALGELLRVPFDSALQPRFTTPLILPAIIAALAMRGRLQTAPLVYAFGVLAATATRFGGPLAWAAYPDVYLKHFPQLLVVAPVFGVGAVALLTLAEPRLGRHARLAAPLAAIALVATSWASPDATRLLFAERVMEREIAALEEAFESLPRHRVVYAAGALPPPEGIPTDGDQLEMHFPVGLYRYALAARGVPPGPVRPLNDLLGGEVSVEEDALVYVGSTLRSFYPGEIRAGQIPESLERPELTRIRARYRLEPAHLFAVSTDEPDAIEPRVAAGRLPEVGLGFYWVRPRRGEEDR